MVRVTVADLGSWATKFNLHEACLPFGLLECMRLASLQAGRAVSGPQRRVWTQAPQSPHRSLFCPQFFFFLSARFLRTKYRGCISCTHGCWLSGGKALLLVINYPRQGHPPRVRDVGQGFVALYVARQVAGDEVGELEAKVHGAPCHDGVQQA